MGFELLQTWVKFLTQPVAWTSHFLGLNFLNCEMSTESVLDSESTWHKAGLRHRALSAVYVRTCAHQVPSCWQELAHR